MLPTVPASRYYISTFLSPGYMFLWWLKGMMKSLCTSSPIDYFLALFRYLNALMIPVSTPHNLQIKEMGGGLGQK